MPAFKVGSMKKITDWSIFQGIGYGMIVVSFLVMLYYNIVIAYSSFYMFSGMAKVLPWSTCNNDWNTLGTRAACIITEACFEFYSLKFGCLYQKQQFKTSNRLWTKLNSTVKLMKHFGEKIQQF